MNNMAGNLKLKMPINSDIDIFERSNFGITVIIMGTFDIFFFVMGEPFNLAMK